MSSYSVVESKKVALNSKSPWAFAAATDKR